MDSEQTPDSEIFAPKRARSNRESSEKQLRDVDKLGWLRLGMQISEGGVRRQLGSKQARLREQHCFVWCSWSLILKSTFGSGPMSPLPRPLHPCQINFSCGVAGADLGGKTSLQRKRCKNHRGAVKNKPKPSFIQIHILGGPPLHPRTPFLRSSNTLGGDFVRSGLTNVRPSRYSTPIP